MTPVSALAEMRETVARAIWLAQSSAANKQALWLTFSEFDREPYLRSADAVLIALGLFDGSRVVVPVVPSDEMVDRALAATSWHRNIPGSQLTVNREKMRIRAMLAAALTKGSPDAV